MFEYIQACIAILCEFLFTKSCHTKNSDQREKREIICIFSSVTIISQPKKAKTHDTKDMLLLIIFLLFQKKIIQLSGVHNKPIYPSLFYKKLTDLLVDPFWHVKILIFLKRFGTEDKTTSKGSTEKNQ